jgi:outer membrane lipoprotein SlyB
MKRVLVFAAILAALVFSSCAKNEPGTTTGQTGQHATVTLKDGTVNQGSVVASSNQEVTIAGDDKITRTIPMDQVRSIEYGDAPVVQTTEPLKAANEAMPEIEKPAAPVTKSAAPVAKATSAAPIATATPAAPVEKSKPELELPAGSEIAIRTDVAIDSATASEGQTFPGEVTKDLKDAAGNIVIPVRSSALIIIKSASGGGRIRGASDLVLDVKSVKIGGQQYNLYTTDVTKLGKSGVGANKRTATYTGGGAAVGAIIGAIAGGGKGAAIGAASGAGAGALTQILTKGSSIKIPAESILTFQLEKPLRISAGAQ